LRRNSEQAGTVAPDGRTATSEEKLPHPHPSKQRNNPYFRPTGDKKTDVTSVSSLNCPGLRPFRDWPWQEVDRALKEARLVREGWRYSSARVYVKRGSRASPRCAPLTAAGCC